MKCELCHKAMIQCSQFTDPRQWQCGDICGECKAKSDDILAYNIKSYDRRAAFGTDYYHSALDRIEQGTKMALVHGGYEYCLSLNENERKALLEKK